MISAATSFFVGALAVGDPTFLPQKYLGLALSNAGNLTAMMKMTVAQFATVGQPLVLPRHTLHLSLIVYFTPSHPSSITNHLTLPR